MMTGAIPATISFHDFDCGMARHFRSSEPVASTACFIDNFACCPHTMAGESLLHCFATTPRSQSSL